MRARGNDNSRNSDNNDGDEIYCDDGINSDYNDNGDGINSNEIVDDGINSNEDDDMNINYNGSDDDNANDDGNSSV